MNHKEIYGIFLDKKNDICFFVILFQMPILLLSVAMVSS